MVSWFDILILIPLAFGAFMGFKKGFVIEATSVLALLFGIYGAIGFSNFTEKMLNEKTGSTSSAMPVLAFILTFLVIVVAIYFLGKLLEGVVKITMMGIFNRIAGLFFGVLKLALICSCLIVIINKYDADSSFFDENVKTKSILYKPVAAFSPTVFPGIKKVMEQNPIKEAVEDVKERVGGIR